MRLLLWFVSLVFVACGPNNKSGVATSTGGKIEDLTDRSVCGPATANGMPLAGTSWSETLRWEGKVKWVRSLSFVGSTIVARQKATEILSGKSESIRASAQPKGNAFEANELGQVEKTLTLNDGTAFTFRFDDKVGVIRYARVGNCLSINNGSETTILVPEL